MAIYYVSRQNGNDANAGTSVGAAKATVVAGLNLMSAGDTLYIGPGRYQEKITDSSIAAGTDGSETKIIGDPECQYVTSDNPGIVRITGCDSNENSTSGTVWDSDTRNYVHIKNLNIDGCSNTYSVQARGVGQVWENCVIMGRSGVDGGFGSRALLKKCLVIGNLYAVGDTNTEQCILIARNVAAHKGYHMGSIATAYSKGFWECYDQSFEGTTNSSRGSCYNCLAIGALTNFEGCSGYNNIALSGFYGFYFPNGEGEQSIGSLAIACERAFRSLDGTHTYNGTSDSLQNAIYYGTANYQSINSSVVNDSTHVNFSINAVDHILKAFEPLNTMPSGTVDTNLISLGVKQNGQTNSFIPTDFEGTSGTGGSSPSNFVIPKQDGAGKMILTSSWANPGPYFINNTQSLDYTNTSGSEFSIRVDGFGSMNFNMPVSASQPFTASVGVKYNVGSVPPQLIVSSSYPQLIDPDFTALSDQASGTGDQTGAWQTLSVSGTSSIDTSLNIILLQGDGHPTGSSFAIFAKPEVNE